MLTVGLKEKKGLKEICLSWKKDRSLRIKQRMEMEFLMSSFHSLQHKFLFYANCNLGKRGKRRKH